MKPLDIRKLDEWVGTRGIFSDTDCDSVKCMYATTIGCGKCVAYGRLKDSLNFERLLQFKDVTDETT